MTNHDERRFKRNSNTQVRRDNAETVPQCSGGVSAGTNAGNSQTFGVRTRNQKLHDQGEADVEQPRCADDSPAPMMGVTLPSPYDVHPEPKCRMFHTGCQSYNSFCDVPSVARWGAYEL